MEIIQQTEELMKVRFSTFRIKKRRENRKGLLKLQFKELLLTEISVGLPILHTGPLPKLAVLLYSPNHANMYGKKLISMQDKLVNNKQTLSQTELL